jgi:hypothetical protein
VNERSASADLTILGFRGEMLKRLGEEVFLGYDRPGDLLFVNTLKEIEIERTLEGPVPENGAKKAVPAEATALPTGREAPIPPVKEPGKGS